MPPIPSSELDLLLSSRDLECRIRELARNVSRSYSDDPPIPIAVLSGARTFAEHL